MLTKWIKTNLVNLKTLELLKLPNWKYVITTAGSELPIRSHRKLREDLKAANGFDVFVSFPFPYRHFERFNETHEMQR